MNTAEKIARASNSKTFKRLNPHLFVGGEDDAEHDLIEALTKPKEKEPKRVRQNSKPLLNKLETEYSWLLGHWGEHVHAQSITLKLANGVRYTPDFFSLSSVGSGRPKAWEVKGKHAWEDSLLKIKFAAKEYPEIKFLLVWKEKGKWCQQEVLP